MESTTKQSLIFLNSQSNPKHQSSKDKEKDQNKNFQSKTAERRVKNVSAKFHKTYMKLLNPKKENFPTPRIGPLTTHTTHQKTAGKRKTPKNIQQIHRLQEKVANQSLKNAKKIPWQPQNFTHTTNNKNGQLCCPEAPKQPLCTLVQNRRPCCVQPRNDFAI